jgi:hypothetical protein
MKLEMPNHIICNDKKKYYDVKKIYIYNFVNTLTVTKCDALCDSISK